MLLFKSCATADAIITVSPARGSPKVAHFPTICLAAEYGLVRLPRDLPTSVVLTGPVRQEAKVLLFYNPAFHAVHFSCCLLRIQQLIVALNPAKWDTAAVCVDA